MNRFRKTLTYMQLLEEFRLWWVDEHKFGHSQRFGQRMVNKYLLDGETAPEIFNEKDGTKALDLIGDEILPKWLKNQALS